MNELLAEWILGRPLDEGPSTFWMDRGSELEAQAISAFEFQSEIETEPGGFFTTSDGRIGASPDRLIGTDRLLEIKCGKPSTHVGYMLTNELESDYKVQLQGQLYVTERQAVEVVSYCPEMPPVIISVGRDEKYIESLASALNCFTSILAAKKEELERRFGPFKRDIQPEQVDTLGVNDDDLAVLIAHHEKVGTWAGAQ